MTERDFDFWAFALGFYLANDFLLSRVVACTFPNAFQLVLTLSDHNTSAFPITFGGGPPRQMPQLYNPHENLDPAFETTTFLFRGPKLVLGFLLYNKTRKVPMKETF